MRTRTATFVVPPYNGHVFPHESFPPWQSLRRVFAVVSAARRASARATPWKHLDLPLVQASKRIVAVARGDLPLAHWHRRVRVAIEKLERAKRAIGVYLRAEMLTIAEGQTIADAVDETIALLVEAVARAPLPDEIRVQLPALHVPARLVH